MLGFFGKKQKGRVRFTPSSEWLEERHLLTVSFLHMTLGASTSVAGKQGSTYNNPINQPTNISPISITQKGTASAVVSGKTVTTSYAFAASSAIQNSNSTSGTSSLSGSVTASSQPKNAAAYASLINSERYDITSPTASVLTITYNISSTAPGVYGSGAGAGFSVTYKNTSGTAVTDSYSSGHGTLTLTLTANAMSTLGVIINPHIVDSIAPVTPQATAVTVSSSCVVSWNLAPAPPPDIVMDMATTTDHSTVTATYDINSLPITQPLTFNIYRSAKQGVYTAADLIGTDTLSSSDTADLSVGHHQLALKLTSGTLLPDPAHEFVTVVANPGKTIMEPNYTNDTAGFRIYVLGVVAHGFPFQGSTATPAWETSMASNLKSIDKYDDAIAFNWIVMGAALYPGEATAAGDILYKQVVDKSHQLASGHPGDVVDLHFIGHSRGTVVVCQAMHDLVGTTDPILKGSYIKATLLDPHPANISTIVVASVNPLAIASPAFVLYQLYETVDNDAQIVIPSNVNYVEIAYQHSWFHDFGLSSSEFYLNLWGEGPTDGIISQSTSPIHWINLTDMFDAAFIPGTKNPIGAIGHAEMYTWYEVHTVDAGKLL